MAIFRRIVTVLVNQVKTSTVTASTGGSTGVAVANYPATNIQTPEELFTPSKMTGPPTLFGGWDIDRGVTTPFDYVGMSRVNFASIKWSFGTTAAHTADPYQGLEPVTRSPLNGRYNWVKLPTTPLTYRYLRLYCDPQATLPESMLAAQTTYLMGGVFVGTIVYPPLNWLWDVEFESIYPRKKIAPDDDSWEQYLLTGNQRLRIRGKKIARTNPTTPSASDEFARYMDYDRQLFEAEFFALHLNSGDMSCALVVRNDGDRVSWQRTTRNHVESSLELVEVLKT